MSSWNGKCYWQWKVQSSGNFKNWSKYGDGEIWLLIDCLEDSIWYEHKYRNCETYSDQQSEHEGSLCQNGTKKSAGKPGLLERITDDGACIFQYNTERNLKVSIGKLQTFWDQRKCKCQNEKSKPSWSAFLVSRAWSICLSKANNQAFYFHIFDSVFIKEDQILGKTSSFHIMIMHLLSQDLQ
jgi:hypothetical protein